MNRLSLLDLHQSALNRTYMNKIKGGADIRCICSYNNPLVTTRESGGSNELCFCSDTPVSKGVSNRPLDV